MLSPDGEHHATIALQGRAVRVGREADNDIVLAPDLAQLVSREHCVIEPTGRRWWLRDLESRNHTFLERSGQRARIDHEELLTGDAVCVLADAETAGAPPARHWRIVFSDPGQTQLARLAGWLQYFPAAETVWVLGGVALPRRVDAPPKARRMLLVMLARHRELGEPAEGVMVSQRTLKAALWPDDGDPERRTDSALANVAWELRAALGDEQHEFLRTEKNEGYRLVPRP